MKVQLNRKTVSMIKILSLMLVLVFLLAYVSFSWIKREWSPKISQDNISIATSGALVFQFTENGNEVTTNKSVNEILGVNDFALRPVSSSSGKAGEFFTLEHGKEVGEEQFKHLNFISEGYASESALGIRYGYIVLNFKLMLSTLEGDEARRFIFLNPNSKIESTSEGQDVTSAIRISIFSEQAGIEPIIVSTETAKMQDSVGVNTAKRGDGSFIADGERLFDTYVPDGEQIRNEKSESGVDLLKKQTIRTLEECDGETSTGEFAQSEALFAIDPHSSVNITVCIWLEGEDPLCNDAITEDQISLLLQFSAKTAVVA